MAITPPRIIVIGGGAAGFFGAIAAAEQGAEVLLLEKSSHFLSKVRISGGGRCNVTHACFDPKELSHRYPRGGRALISPFHRFQPSDTVEWFENRGAKLKTEADGRIFPISDSSQTIIDTLLDSAAASGVKLLSNTSITNIERHPDHFILTSSKGDTFTADAVLLAVGGTRAGDAARLASDPGHHLLPPIPSLFTFEIALPWLRSIPGVVAEVEATIPGTKLRERGPLLITHWGVSGPAILRLSAWGARELAALDYHFPLQLNWLGGLSSDDIALRLHELRLGHPARLVAGLPPAPLPVRLWERLLALAGVQPGTTWNRLPREHTQALVQILARTKLPVTGKSLNKEEFVTCGGVTLPEVDFKTLQSRKCPGLFFAGEILDIDGITGGFNFQAAWTTGWIAGHAMVESFTKESTPLIS